MRRLGYLALALLAYVPVLRSSPGMVAADTKSYLYLDPGRLLARASSMWDPNIGLGTVTHQNIGYLFPMGPYYWVAHMFGIPAWVSQRIWLGSIYFVAALGVLFLLRTLKVRGPGAPVAALAFMLTPYTLDFASRISVILLPFAGLPWLLALTIRALRDDRGWMYPAIFAFVVQIIGGVNATALVFAGIAPVLWVVFAVWIDREISFRRAFAVVVKIGVLTLGASAWWIVGLSLQGGYGLNVLKYTETLETVSQASLPGEVLRGLGYWFFYGRDKLGLWTESSYDYMAHTWSILVSFAVPVLALCAAALVRWRHRAYFVVLALVGTIVAVGAHPYDDPSTIGGLFKSFAASSSFGLALRSTGRAVPLVALGFAVLLGVGVSALAERWAARSHSARGLVLAGVVIALVILNLPAIWQGSFYGKNLLRDENIPDYWTQAIAAMDAGSHQTRVLELPGADFASYRWGDTVDPITPGLMDRPYVARELIPWGSPASADLLNALDRRIQEGVLNPASLAPIAKLLNAGDIAFRADLATDRFDLARSDQVWQLLQDAPGLGAPRKFGTSLGNPLQLTQHDEIELAMPPRVPDPPPVSLWSVEGTPDIVSSTPSAAPLIVAGDGEGLVDLAAIGALSGDNIILYSGSYAATPAKLKSQIARDGAVLVVTDSNRKRGRRWGAIRDVEGATERADETALTKDEGDAQLDLFPDANTSAQTVVVDPSAEVSTTRYGNKITYWQEDRGSRAFDGDTSTAWEFGTHDTVTGERLRLDLSKPITTDHVNLVQRLHGDNGRYITQVTLTFDGGDPVTVNLDDASRTPDGQTVTFPSRAFSRMEIRVDAANTGDDLTGPVNNVGFSEIRLRDNAPGATDVRVDEVVRMPTDLTTVAGKQAAARTLIYEMSRSRTIVVTPRTAQDEPALVREFDVPDARTFGSGGTMRLSTQAPGEVTDQVVGLLDATQGGTTVSASSQLEGTVSQRPSQAIDGDPKTIWSSQFGTQEGQWLDVRTAAPVTFDHLNLQLVADGLHSVPTQVRIDAGGQSRTVDLPTVTDGKERDSVVSAPVSFAPLTGDDVRVTVTQVRNVQTTEYHELTAVTMPVAIAELGLPGVQRAPVPEALPAACRTDLLTLDGRPIGARLVGTTADALAGRPVDLELCDPDVPLAAGTHTLRSVPGTVSGIDVDGFVLASAPGGAALALGPGGEVPQSALAIPAHSVAATPSVKVTDNGRTKIQVQVRGATPGRPFWLVLGQSNNAGWQASVAGSDIGGSQLVNGYANGWLVRPPSANFTVTLKWKPQERVWIALVVSGFTLALCGLLVVLQRKRARERLASVATRDEAPVIASPLVASGSTPGTTATVVTALATGLVAGFVSRWWIGAVAALLVFAVSRWPRLRPALTFGAPGALALVGLYTAVQQYRNQYFPTFEWPKHFDRVNNLAWLAILLLACDAVVEVLRRRAATRGDVDDEPTAIEDEPDQGAPSAGAEPPETEATVPAR
jgi:arabinofuranan 3-O-arabinosyltransferase